VRKKICGNKGRERRREYVVVVLWLRGRVAAKGKIN
jgi:uncharacterized membrane protein YhaH (DUF805 family)